MSRFDITQTNVAVKRLIETTTNPATCICCMPITGTGIWRWPGASKKSLPTT